jgi:hypothetical protein
MQKWWEYNGEQVQIEKLPTAMICLGLVMVIVGLLILWV